MMHQCEDDEGFDDLFDIITLDKMIEDADKWKGGVFAPTKLPGLTDIHTCHDQCPCRSGGNPMSDFIRG